MVLLKVLLILVSIGFSNVSGLSCWYCQNQRSQAACLGNGRLRLCPRISARMSCQTEVRFHQGWGGIPLITTGCKETIACRNNQNQNNRFAWPSRQCNPKRQNSVCRCCCRGDGCNQSNLLCRQKSLTDRLNVKATRTIPTIVTSCGVCKGEKGATEEKGIKGETGNSGLPGLNGTKGESGIPGVPGSPGVMGHTGRQVLAGAVAQQGRAGTDERNGSIGSNGDKGDHGDPGPKGFVGETGRNDRVIRLINSNGYVDRGRVEILHSGVWGTICDDSWDMNDGRVVCRMLGFSGVVSAPASAAYGQGTGKIWLDDVNCAGNESNIAECSKKTWGEHNCQHSEDASVQCRN